MNKEYIYINGNVVVRDEKGSYVPSEYHDNLDEVLSAVALFNKERYVVLLDKYSYDDTEIFRDHKVRGLTEKGYKTLDLVRDVDTWTLIKEKIDNFDELSIFTVFNTADKITNVKCNTLFDNFISNINYHFIGRLFNDSMHKKIVLNLA